MIVNLAVAFVGIYLPVSLCGFSLVNAHPHRARDISLWRNAIRGLPVVRRALAVVSPSGGEGLDAVYGQLHLEETLEGVFVTGTISGLKPGRHGFHVHQEGNLGNNCKASGGHYNPAGVSTYANYSIIVWHNYFKISV